VHRLQDGERAWKDGHYGHGQLLLLSDADVLLVLSEEGELVLVAATAGRVHRARALPRARGQDLEPPVLAGDLLLVRNAEEMAAFRLALADG
jgi:hypothetical protein